MNALGRFAAVSLVLYALGGTDAVWAQTPSQPPRFRVVDMGLPVGSAPIGLSGAGHTAGSYFGLAGQRRGFVWRGGSLLDIGTLAGVSQASAVNEAGTAVGYSVDTQNRQRAVVFSNSALADLGTLQGGTHAAANDINSTGWVVGMSERRFGADTYQRASLWRNGQVLDLGTFGGEYSEASALNDAGQVVGWAWTPFPQRRQHAFLWSDATGLVDLGTLGGVDSMAADINDQGVVVGSARDAQQQLRAFKWTPQGGMLNLGAPPSAFESSAAAVNDAGQIVGNSFNAVECRNEPLLWENGAMHLLVGLVDLASGWTVVSASDINDAGVIVGTAQHVSGNYRAVQLVPIVATSPAPAGPVTPVGATSTTRR